MGGLFSEGPVGPSWLHQDPTIIHLWSLYLQLDYKQSEDRDCHVFCQPIPTFPSPITFINSKYVVRQINYETIQVKITKKKVEIFIIK